MTPGMGATPRTTPNASVEVTSGMVVTPRITPNTGSGSGMTPGMGATPRTTPPIGSGVTPGTGAAPRTTPPIGSGVTPGTGSAPMANPYNQNGMYPWNGTTPPYIYNPTPEAPPVPQYNNSQPYAPYPQMAPGMSAPGMNAPINTEPGAQYMIPPTPWNTSPALPNNMPNMYAPYQGIPNMQIPDASSNAPMGVPMFPLYGYDNSADLDRDAEYMKRLYPRTARTIQREIENECDKMEYDGSMMFDEYPDKEYFERLVDRIYERINKTQEEPQVETNSLYLYPPRRSENHLRDIVTLLLLSEMFNRRRRYRSRKRWF